MSITILVRPESSRSSDNDFDMITVQEDEVPPGDTVNKKAKIPERPKSAARPGIYIYIYMTK